MTKKQIINFVNLAKGKLTYDNFENRLEFHKEGKKFLRYVAKQLGLQKGHFIIHSNMGGIAVSGEITLISDKLYICMGPDFGFYFRQCRSMIDYSGRRNHWMQWDDLLNEDKAIGLFLDVMNFPNEKEY